MPQILIFFFLENNDAIINNDKNNNLLSHFIFVNGCTLIVSTSTHDKSLKYYALDANNNATNNNTVIIMNKIKCFNKTQIQDLTNALDLKKI